MLRLNAGAGFYVTPASAQFLEGFSKKWGTSLKVHQNILHNIFTHVDI